MTVDEQELKDLIRLIVKELEAHYEERLDKQHDEIARKVREIEQLREDLAIKTAEWTVMMGEDKRLRAALQQTAVALGEAVRSLRAWANPTTGMGANISQEDRSRWQLALREYERARPLIDAVLSQPEAASECSTCKLRAMGMPTPGYSHTPGCPEAAPEEKR